MALTTVSAGNKVTQWDSNFFAEYVRDNRFKRYMGTNENAIIQLIEDLTVKRGGKVVLTLIAKLTGAGVTGNNLLEGNEEALANYDFGIEVNTLRHAVAVTDHEQQFTEIELRNAAKTMLKLWSMEKLRDALIAALASIDGVPFGTSSAAQRNTWLTNNGDRVLFGASVANNTGVHATSLQNIDTTDKLTRQVVSLAKRRAQMASPIIRPVRVTEDEEAYVMFANSLAFRDLREDLSTIHKDAMERGKNNPLFRGGDLLWDNVVIREVPEIPLLSGAGASGIQVGPNYLCGAQALGIAWAKRTKSTTDVRDYGFVKGVGVHEMRGVEKCRFDDKDHGVLTVFAAAEPDA